MTADKHPPPFYKHAVYTIILYYILFVHTCSAHTRFARFMTYLLDVNVKYLIDIGYKSETWSETRLLSELPSGLIQQVRAAIWYYYLFR